MMYSIITITFASSVAADGVRDDTQTGFHAGNEEVTEFTDVLAIFEITTEKRTCLKTNILTFYFFFLFFEFFTFFFDYLRDSDFVFRFEIGYFLTIQVLIVFIILFRQLFPLKGAFFHILIFFNFSQFEIKFIFLKNF